MVAITPAKTRATASQAATDVTTRVRVQGLKQSRRGSREPKRCSGHGRQQARGGGGGGGQGHAGCARVAMSACRPCVRGLRDGVRSAERRVGSRVRGVHRARGGGSRAQGGVQSAGGRAGVGTGCGGERGRAGVGTGCGGERGRAGGARGCGGERGRAAVGTGCGGETGRAVVGKGCGGESWGAWASGRGCGGEMAGDLGVVPRGGRCGGLGGWMGHLLFSGGRRPAASGGWRQRGSSGGWRGRAGGRRRRGCRRG